MPLAAFDTTHCNVDLEPSPIEPSWIIEGNPEARSRVLSTSGCKTAWTLIWSCTEGRFNWHYDFDETIMILEGSIVLEGDSMPPKRYGVGDVVFFRNGTRVAWHVDGYVKKVAFCHLTNAPGLGYAIRALNKFRSVIRRNSPVLVPALGCFNLLG